LEPARRDLYRHGCPPVSCPRFPHGTWRYAQTVPGTLPPGMTKQGMGGSRAYHGFDGRPVDAVKRVGEVVRQGSAAVIVRVPGRAVAIVRP
jgi:hypothetical protein